ncbi:MAG TPA: nuclear transport factor 2 family protein [Streptosporangiaceae bacterium]|nr:nuclear transport factor 2 family protein [Streptosporangiaceae bacterium]
MNGSTDPTSLVRRLAAATNAHDLDALTACFADDYLNETPAHPARGFRGAEQVRRNWAQLFAGIPDLSARILATVGAADTVWAEWEMSGTRRDGAPHLMRGVIIFGVEAGKVRSARFYLEPVEGVSGGVDAQISRVVPAAPQHRARP